MGRKIQVLILHQGCDVGDIDQQVHIFCVFFNHFILFHEQNKPNGGESSTIIIKIQLLLDSNEFSDGFIFCINRLDIFR